MPQASRAQPTASLALPRAGFRAVLLALLVGAGAIAAPARVFPAPPALDRSLAELADAIAARIRGRGLTVAVPDVPTLEGRPTVLGRYVAEELITALYARGVPVVERALLDRAMSELQLGLTELMSPSAVKRFGRLVGAHAIVVGTLTDVGESVKLNARIVAVETGHVVGAASTSLARDAQTTAMLAQAVTPRRVLPKAPAGDGEETSAAGVFWQEDFSAYDDGDPLPAWGPNVIVRKYPNGRSYLGSLMPGVHPVRRSQRFRKNFSLEFDLAMDGTHEVAFELVLVDEKGDELRLDCRYSGWRVWVTLPGVHPQRLDSRGIHTLKLVKNGTTYKVYVSGMFASTGVYSGYGRFVGFKLTVPSRALFSNFVATGLPR